ncbi:hypothetical protein [Pseudomonas putida]|uniref:hypothetical protein n=1 Tax=Pseudomonas putida TaxID=303 RepID=UPI002366F223|nr:hypothetical protein [Pseudomonas putida]MDD2050494.1 hypothetical protein [Pseudomonas putida]
MTSLPDTQVIDGLKNLILDPDEVRNGTNANIPQYRDKAEGDIITLRWEGRSTFTTNVTVDGGNANAPIPVRIAYEPYIIGNLDNSVSVIYEVKRQNGRTATSQPLALLIKRQLGQNLVAPTVREASGNTLNPIQAINGATVRVTYTGMLPDDVLVVDWQGEGGADSYQSAQQNGSAFGYVDFAIPVSVVAASQGKTITVRYNVVRGGNPGLLSEPLALVVGALSQSALPAPTVPEASAGTLDLTTFQGNATVNVQPWPLIAIGQRYWTVVGGTLVNGNPYSFYVAQSQLVDENHVRNGLSMTMLRSELEKLRSASSVSLEVKVAFEGGVSEAGARVFPTLALMLLNIPRTLPAPTVPEAESGAIYKPNAGASIRVPATANLRAGEQVRGVTGGLYTDAVTVTQPGATLNLVVPVEQLFSLVDQGQKAWAYEVLVNGTWATSATLPITVRDITFVSGREGWSARGAFNLSLNTPYPYPSGVTLQLLQSDTHEEVSTRVVAPVPPKTSYYIDIVAASTIKVSFNGSVRSVVYRFGAIFSTAGPAIEFWDKGGLIERRVLPVTEGSYPFDTFKSNERFPEWIILTGTRKPGNWWQTSFVLAEIEWGYTQLNNLSAGHSLPASPESRGE